MFLLTAIVDYFFLQMASKQEAACVCFVESPVFAKFSSAQTTKILAKIGPRLNWEKFFFPGLNDPLTRNSPSQQNILPANQSRGKLKSLEIQVHHFRYRLHDQTSFLQDTGTPSSKQCPPAKSVIWILLDHLPPALRIVFAISRLRSGMFCNEKSF